MTDGNDGQKPAASSANAKLDALAEAAAAATSQSGLQSRRREDNASAHYDSDLDQQQPAEVTPNNTFESSIEHAAASSSSAASTNAAKPSAVVGNSALTSDPSCPWKNRQDLLALWKKRYSELLTYRQQHGHVNVPQRYEANPELGRWVKDQRAFRRNNKLNSERIKLLDDLGFVWKIKKPNDFWMEKFHQLKEYKRTQGNLNPPREGEHKTLACWVDRQRRAGKSGKLTTERLRLLNEVGFVWDPRGDGGSDNVVGNDENKAQPSTTAKESDPVELATSDQTDLSAGEASALPSQEGMTTLSLPLPVSTLPSSATMVASAFPAPYSANSAIPSQRSAMAAPLMSRSNLAYLPIMQGTSIAESEMPNYPTRIPPANSPMYPTFAAPMMTHPTIPSHTTNASYLQAHATMHENLEHTTLPTHYSTMPGSSLPIHHMIHPMAPTTRFDLPIHSASNLPYSMRGYPPTPRYIQLRAMLEEEEMRVSNIMYHSQRTAQLRAMLEEEERHVSNMMYQHRMNEYAYMYALEHAPPTWTTPQETHDPGRPPDEANPPN